MAINHNILLESGTNEFEIVEFVVKTEHKNHHFCINVAKVREVIRFPEVVHIPDAHPAIVGTANIRNSFIPIVDLAKWLGLRNGSNPENSKVIVTYFNKSSNGFMVDEVVRIHRITWAEIKDYSTLTDIQMVDSVLGVINMEERMMQLLDFESIIADINPDTKITDAGIDTAKYSERQKYKLFLAEDSPVIRRLLIQNFTKAGYVVEGFPNGARLLEALADKKPDLVITDLEMPVASGDYVVKKIRENMEKEELPVFVFSSMASEDNERKLKKLGADMFLVKPQLHELVNTVDSYLL